MLPFACIRDNPHVSREEWQWLRILDLSLPIRPTPHQAAFHRALVTAARVLLRDLDVDSDQFAVHRLYRYRIIQLNDDVAFILVTLRILGLCLCDCSLCRR